MPYHVDWVDKALADLAELWTEADSTERLVINAAAQEIDARLGADPLGQGESRSKGRRLMFVGPLAVMFEIDFSQNLVSVLQLKRSQRRK